MGAAAGVATPHAMALRVYVGAFADELVRAGVTDVCICPGSRSTPLAIVLRGTKGLRTWMHLDERSCAFFALGMAKAQRRPVAVVGTSGTAVVNFAPAVAEARFGQVPLLILTSDRPAELRGIGATQTIDQVRLYGSNAKWAEEMILPEATPAAVRYVRAIADRAVATALAGPMGPVHLNFPFREPLVPAPADAVHTFMDGVPPTVTVSRGRRVPDDAQVRDLTSILTASDRGIVVAGPQDDALFPDAAVALARRLGWPLLADVLSGARRRPTTDDLVLDAFDVYLRDPALCDALAPDTVLRFGATPVSKPLQQFLERCNGARQVLVAEDDTWIDQNQSATDIVYADATSLCEALTTALPASETRSPFAEAWLDADRRASASMRADLDAETVLTEPGVFHRLGRVLPDDAIVFAGNSMPVRDLDSFVRNGVARQTFMANRGVSGIDGVVSTALGLAAASGRPTLLAIGDVSFYHDMNGLLAAQRYGDRLNCTILIVNNDGGGIFSFLPRQTADESEYEELFGTPHGLDFRHAAALYGLEHTTVGTPAALEDALRASMQRAGVQIIEAHTDRVDNVARHNDLWRRAIEAVREGRN